MLRYISGKDTDLAIVDLASCAAVLPCYPNRVLAFFEKAAFVKDQSSIGAAKVIINKTTIFRNDFVVIPWCNTDKS